jgi:hypothetical protein
MLKVKYWLKQRHSKHWTAMTGLRQNFTERPSDKMSRDFGLGQEMQASNMNDWPLYNEAAPTYHGPLGKQYVQKMWPGGGILQPYTLSMANTGWT